MKNYIKLLAFLFALIFTTSKSFAQEEFTIMQYNLLYYGLEIFDCTNSNNSTTDKNSNLSTILSYAQPDILCVNEMGKSNANADNLLNNALNSYGSKTYARASLTGNASITNMIFYNTAKFILIGQETSYSYPRSIDIYKFKYTESAFGSADVPYFTVISSHLKAGSDADDEADRLSGINNLMARISQLGEGNYFLTGDFNVYSSNDDGFQRMINYSDASLNFHDPVNQLGSWSNNSSYADYHTQSSHYSGDCAVGGGLDDRFDFIMISGDVKDGTDKLSYRQGSYETIGQDGDHFNSSVNWNGNNSVSTTVASALYEMSDHLPVMLKVDVETPAVSISTDNFTEIAFQNPFTDILSITNIASPELSIHIYSISSQLVFQEKTNNSSIDLNLSFLDSGIYIMKVTNGEQTSFRKIIKH